MRSFKYKLFKTRETHDFHRVLTSAKVKVESISFFFKEIKYTYKVVYRREKVKGVRVKKN